MIESEEKRKRLTEAIEHWCKHTKVKPYLREHDIPSLVHQIIEEFYHISLCCGHYVEDFADGVHIGFYTYEGKTDEITEGLYCKDCAERYKKKLGAWEIVEPLVEE